MELYRIWIHCPVDLFPSLSIIRRETCKMTAKNLLSWTIYAWAFTGIGLLVVNPISHLLWPGFIDHAGEVTMASLSWLLYQGQPLYTTADSPYLYSLEHGPILYLLQGAFLTLLDPGFLTAKLHSFLAIIAVLTLSCRWFRHYLSWRHTFWLLGFEGWLLNKWYYIYLSRGDSLMLLCTLTALYFVTTRRGWTALLGTALPLGILINLKIHGPFYALPILALLFETQGWRGLWRAAGIMAGLWLVPFLVPNISLVNYLHWITASVSHGISRTILMGNLTIVVLLLSVPLSFALCHRFSLATIWARHRLFLATATFSLIVIGVLGSHSGSGSYHLAPFVPILLYSVLLLWQERTDLTSRVGQASRHWASAAFCAIVVLAIMAGAVNGQGRLLQYHSARFTVSKTLYAEFSALQAKYHGQTMMIGYGREGTYRFYDQFIPLLVFAGNPYLLDMAHLCDMRFPGQPLPPATVDKLAQGETQLWLFPRGSQPFGITRLFDDKFRQTFFRHYTLLESSDHFDVWSYQD